jgi:hypothetical protein
MRFERRCGFGQVPSDGLHFVPVLSDVADGVWFFSAALVGPIANLNAAPFSESNADASCGIAIATAPISIRRSTWRPMMFMMWVSQKWPCGEANSSFSRAPVKHSIGVLR